MSDPFDDLTAPAMPDLADRPAPDNPTTYEPTTGVTITLDPEQLLRALTSYGRAEYDDESGGPAAAAVISVAGQQLAHDLRSLVRSQLTDVMRERVDEIVRETLAEGVRKTNTWGEPVGEPTTVAGLVRDEVQKYLTIETGDYRKRETQIAKTTREIVDAAVKADLATSLEAARKALRDRYTASAAELITETVRRATL
jgi:hypothetical protein